MSVIGSQPVLHVVLRHRLASPPLRPALGQMLWRFRGELRWRGDGVPKCVPDELGFVRIAALLPYIVDLC